MLIISNKPNATGTGADTDLRGDGKMIWNVFDQAAFSQKYRRVEENRGDFCPENKLIKKKRNLVFLIFMMTYSTRPIQNCS